MAVNRMGKPAVTHYEVLERFAVHTYLRCLLETGRTHQIRVHMQYLKAPIVGDPVYGLRGIVPHQSLPSELREVLSNFKRQALHAIRLGLIHPATGEPMEWQIELPADMKRLLEAMRAEGAPQAEGWDEIDYEAFDEEYPEEGDGEELAEDEDVE